MAPAVFLTALVLRLVHVWQMRGTLFFSVLMGDSRGYDAWAQQLAAGDWIGSDVFYQAPLYPYFLGLIYTVFGRDFLAVRLVQAVIGALSCVAVGDAAARIISPRAGLIAGLMLAFYPPAIFFDGLVQKSVLDVFFVCVSLSLIARISTGGRTPRRWAGLGLAMGALALTRENALVLIAVVALWAAIGETIHTKDTKDTNRKSTTGTAGTNRNGATGTTGTNRNGATGTTGTNRNGATGTTGTRGTKRAVRLAVSAVPFVAGVAVALLPVAIRNYAVGGGWYLTTSQFGSNLYIGNNPRANGSYVALREGRGSPEFERLDATELAEQATGRHLSPGDVSSYWTGKTIDYVRSQPADWLALLVRKSRLLASSTEVIDTESQESHAEYRWPLALLGRLWHFGVLLPIAVIGGVALWPQRRRDWPLYALTAAYAASVVLFFVVARYRLPLVPMVILFAAAGVCALFDASRAAFRTNQRAFRTTLAACALVAIVANWPLHTAASQQAITENNLGTALQESGRYDEAIAHYRRALTLEADYRPAMNNLGTALRAAGRLDEAIATYDQALAANHDSATMQLNRGNALMAAGRMAEAIAAFRRAAALDPQSPSIRTALARALYDEGTAAIEAGALARASAALQEAIAVKPDYAEAHNNLGIALASQGNLRDAISHWEEALRLAPGLADARRNLELAGRR